MKIKGVLGLMVEVGTLDDPLAITSKDLEAVDQAKEATEVALPIAA